MKLNFKTGVSFTTLIKYGSGLCLLLALAACDNIGGSGEEGAILMPWDGDNDRTLPIARTLDKHLVVGYQGWFRAKGDAAGIGWFHYGGRSEEGPRPGNVTIDYWPDLSEAGEDEKYPTPFRHADGSTAMLYSSVNYPTIDRHFKWMKEYGIDSAFMQRFGVSLKGDRRDGVNMVLRNARRAANQHERAYAVMYDLSGLDLGEIRSVVMEDWKYLVDQKIIGGDPAYQRHNGRPLVAVWGVGFGDGRKYTLKECEELIDFLKNDPQYGGCTVMLGVPYYWRELGRDTLEDPELHRIMQKADIISPWAVGRYQTLDDVEARMADYQANDLKWLNERNLEYMPVLYSGFSWHNLRKTRDLDRPLDQIPRLGGRFLWAQANAARSNGVNMVYIAMFDEMDEGTQIFKVHPNPPVGESPFLSYGDLPTDYYLWLAGRVRALIRNEIPNTKELPTRSN